MADKVALNHPDILGHITNGQRLTMGVVQLAGAVRPRVVRAGKPFDVVILIQNASDARLDVSATVNLPEKDAKKKKGKFVVKADKVVIGVEPAEVGYITVPVSTMPDTAVSPDYQVNVDIDINPVNKGKPKRVRHAEGGGEVAVDHLDEDTLSEIESLQKLNFSVEKQGGFRSSGMVVPFSVLSGTVGALTDLQPGWTSLWTLKDQVDDSIFLEKYGDIVKQQVLPNLTIDKMYQPLFERTLDVFAKVGFDLQATEASCITRMLALILAYAKPTQELHIVAGNYNVERVINDEGAHHAILPYWTSALLKVINRDIRAAKQYIKAITQLCYIDLMHDAMFHAFQRIEATLAQDLGTDVEKEHFIQQVLDVFRGDAAMTLETAYMPLVLGGITVLDVMTLPNEHIQDLFPDIRAMLDAREADRTEDHVEVFELAERLLDKMYLKYGYDANRM